MISGCCCQERKATAMTGVEKAEAERLRAKRRNAAKRVKRAAALVPRPPLEPQAETSSTVQ